MICPYFPCFWRARWRSISRPGLTSRLRSRPPQKRGFRAGLAAALGIGAGSLVWAVFAAGGLAALLAASEHALTVIRIAGGFYLLYLAVRTIANIDQSFDVAGDVNMMAAFRSGAITNLLNPKVGCLFPRLPSGFR